MWHLYLSVPCTVPSLATGLETAAHIPSVGLRSLVPEGAEQLYSLITVFVYSLLPGNFLKYGCKVLRSVSPNSELIQGGIAVEIGWKYCNTNDEKPCRSLGQKIMADSCNRPPRFSEEKLEREFLWKIRVIRNTSVYGII